LAAVHRHAHGRSFAELARFAAVGDIDLDLHFTLRQRRRAGDSVALHREEVVDERRLAIADVEAVAAFQPALRYDHALDAGLRHFDVGDQRPGLVEDARRGFSGEPDLSRIVGERPAIPPEARPAREFSAHPFSYAPIEWKDVVFGGFRPPKV